MPERGPLRQVVLRSPVWASIITIATGCAAIPTCHEPAEAERLAAVEDGRFVSRKGVPYAPRGVNSYPLLDHLGRGREDAVRAIFAQSLDLGRPLIRTGAHMIGGNNPARLRDADGTVREEGLQHLDRLLELAAEYDVQLLLITANHWENYGGAPAVLRAVAPDEDLPTSAFYSDPRAVAHQQDYLTRLVGRTNTRTGQRYGSDSAIFGWALTNEARCTDSDYCDDNTLTRWATTMSATIKNAQARQPVVWGGQGFFDAFGEDLTRIASVSDIDVLTIHLYPDHYGSQSFVLESGADRIPAAIAFGEQWIDRAAALSKATHKPLLVEEAGWRSDAAEHDIERALVLGAWAQTSRTHGAGYVPWMIAEPGRPDYDGYLIRPEHEPATAAVLRCE